MDTRTGTVFVTGANGGLGTSIVSKLASHPEFTAYHGIYTVRDATRAANLQSALDQAPNSHACDILSLDLSRLQDVRQVANDINARVASGDIPPIRALLLNAGYIEYLDQTWTDDGLDMSFVSNYLGHWLLALMLLQSMDLETGRIVILGSWSYNPYDKRNGPMPQKWKTVFHHSADPLARGTWSAAKDDPSWRSGFRRYAAAKLCQVMMIGELQRRLDDDPLLNKISVLGVDPGAFPSELARRGSWVIRVLLYEIVVPALAGLMSWFSHNSTIRTRDQAAENVLFGAFGSIPARSECPSGVIYLDGTVPTDISTEAKDSAKRLMLWGDSIKYTSLKDDETSLVNWK